jgi:hypothetical protein
MGALTKRCLVQYYWPEGSSHYLATGLVWETESLAESDSWGDALSTSQEQGHLHPKCPSALAKCLTHTVDDTARIQKVTLIVYSLCQVVTVFHRPFSASLQSLNTLAITHTHTIRRISIPAMEKKNGNMYLLPRKPYGYSWLPVLFVV